MRKLLLCVLSLLVLTQSAWASVFPSNSATLKYGLTITEKGLSLTIPSEIIWEREGDRYRMFNRTVVPMLGRVGFDSRGTITAGAGITPQSYTEERGKRTWSAQVSNGQLVYSGTDTASQIWQAGTQDRVSVIYALADYLASNTAHQAPGTQITMPVIGRSSISPWVFKVGEKTTVQVGNKNYQAIHVTRVQRSNDKLAVDAWLAPELNWVPVRLLFVVDANNKMDQRLQMIK